MKKVLIVTSSPFNNTKLGKMCSQLMCYLRSKGMMVAVAAWDHDTSWYVEDEEGVCWYEYQSQKVGPVYTVFNVGEGAATKLYDVIKKLQIDTVLSIGDFSEVEYIYAVKSLEKDNIEWINILNNGSVPINDNRSELIDSIDYHILLNEDSRRELIRMGIPDKKYSYLKYGSKFTNEGPKPESDKFGIACVAKNSNQSNLGAFIRAVQFFSSYYSVKQEDNFKVYLHTDLYDNGDYDIEYLLERYGVKDIVELPEEFIGVNDGISDQDLKDKLINYDLIIDCSCQSATGISVLDGMALGLIPVVSLVGALKEIASNINLTSEPSALGLPFIVNGNSFIAADEKEFYIISDVQLSLSMYNFYSSWKKNGLKNLSLAAQNTSKEYNLQSFLENTHKIIKDFKLNTNNLVVETF